MAQRAPVDPVLAALEAADVRPVVPLSDAERVLLAEVDNAEPTVPHAEVVRKLAARPEAE